MAVADDGAVPAAGQAGEGGIETPGAAAVDPEVNSASIGDAHYLGR